MCMYVASTHIIECWDKQGSFSLLYKTRMYIAMPYEIKARPTYNLQIKSVSMKEWSLIIDDAHHLFMCDS